MQALRAKITAELLEGKEVRVHGLTPDQVGALKQGFCDAIGDNGAAVEALDPEAILRRMKRIAR